MKKNPKPPSEFETVIKAIPINVFVVPASKKWGWNSTPKIIVEADLGDANTEEGFMRSNPMDYRTAENIMHDLCEGINASYAIANPDRTGYECMVCDGRACVTWNEQTQTANTYHAFDISRPWWAQIKGRNTKEDQAAFESLKYKIIGALEKLHERHGAWEPDWAAENQRFSERHEAPIAFSSGMVSPFGDNPAGKKNPVTPRQESTRDTSVNVQNMSAEEYDARLEGFRKVLSGQNRRIRAGEFPLER